MKPSHFLLHSFLLVGACVPASLASSLVEQVVVTGTRTEKPVYDSPIDVDVITASELELVASGTVAEALNYIPGISVRRSAKDGFNIYMQGFDSDRVLVLLDGQPIVSPAGDSADLSQISTIDVERIEIVRGAASVLYGSAAMGGVVNIITKEGRQNFLNLTLETGRYVGNEIAEEKYRELAQVSAGLFGEQWQTTLAFQDYQDPGFEYDAQTVSHEAGETDKQTMKAGVGYKSDAVHINYDAQRFTEEKFKINGPFPGEGEAYYRSSVEQTQHDFGVIGEKSWQGKARYNLHDERSGQRTGLRNATIKNVDIDGQYQWQSPTVEWVSGLHYYHESMDQRKIDGTVEVDDEVRDGVEIFLQTDWYATKNIEVLAGIRVQNDSSYGNHSALRFNSMWRKQITQASELSWRSSIGQSYRVPTLKERYFNFDHSNLGYIVQGDENLSPEKSISYNTGIEYTEYLSKDRKLVLAIGVHYADADGFINTEIDSQLSNEGGVSVFVYKNVDEVKVSGGDISVDFGWNENNLQMAYSYVDARDALTNNRLPDRPYHQVKTNLRWNPTRLNFESIFYVVYEKDEMAQDLLEINNEFISANATFRIFHGSRLSWKFGVENIFDDHKRENIDESTEFDARPITSRYFFAGISYRFN